MDPISPFVLFQTRGVNLEKGVLGAFRIQGLFLFLVRVYFDFSNLVCAGRIQAKWRGWLHCLPAIGEGGADWSELSAQTTLERANQPVTRVAASSLHQASGSDPSNQ